MRALRASLPAALALAILATSAMAAFETKPPPKFADVYECAIVADHEEEADPFYKVNIVLSLDPSRGRGSSIDVTFTSALGRIRDRSRQYTNHDVAIDFNRLWIKWTGAFIENKNVRMVGTFAYQDGVWKYIETIGKETITKSLCHPINDL
jgi:hypothetical protein